MKAKQKVAKSITYKKPSNLSYRPTDLRKKDVKKFEWQALRNEIDVTQVWQLILCR